jgi:hypothetical protein
MHNLTKKAGAKRPATSSGSNQPPVKLLHKIKEEEISVSNMAGSKSKEWRSFWVPELNPTAEATKFEKPVCLFLLLGRISLYHVILVRQNSLSHKRGALEI